MFGDHEKGVLICNRCVSKCSGSSEKTKSSKSSKKTPEKLVSIPKPKEIKSFLDRYVISQDDAKMILSVAARNHFKRRVALDLELDVQIDKSNLFLIGPSGVGKTELARSFAKFLNVPFYISDVSRLTSAGYVGDDVESILQGLLGSCNGNVAKAEWGIVFLDEFDKLGRKSGRSASGYRDISGESVQQQLLKLIEGHKVKVPKGTGRLIPNSGSSQVDIVDTTNILFILSGSFEGIQDIVARRLNKASRVGFGSQAKTKVDNMEAYSQIEDDDLLEFGIIPEILGRVPVVQSVYPLSKEHMYQILTQPVNAITKQLQALWKIEDNIDLVFEEEALQTIAQRACDSPKGARALRGILETLLKVPSFQYPSDDTIKSFTVTQEFVEGRGDPKVVRDVDLG